MAFMAIRCYSEAKHPDKSAGSSYHGFPLITLIGNSYRGFTRIIADYRQKPTQKPKAKEPNTKSQKPKSQKAKSQ
jgi:hypothetical protein